MSKRKVEVEMPLHLEDLDIMQEVEGLSSVLIVPCNMCAAVTVAMNENKPFLRLFRNFLKSVPFDQYIKKLQSRLRAKGVQSTLFKCTLPHQWFLCMSTRGRKRKLAEQVKKYEAAIVLGCDSAVETVRNAAISTNCKVIPGMKIGGIANATLQFSLPNTISFQDSKIVSISQEKTR